MLVPQHGSAPPWQRAPGESVFRVRSSAGYELFYTPIPSQEKRAAKWVIDVGFDRLGDALAACCPRRAAVAPASVSSHPGNRGRRSAAALVAASRLTRGYVQTLERSLLQAPSSSTCLNLATRPRARR